MTEGERDQLANSLSEQELVNSVRLTGVSDDENVVSFSLTFKEGPYDLATMDALKVMIDKADDL